MAKKDLIHRFLWFLQHETDSGLLSEEAAEGIEVAKQCLESAFEISEMDPEHNSPTLLEIYAAGLASLRESDPTNVRQPEPTEEEKLRADKLKTQGNLCMSKSQFREAVECYAKAIELNSLNAVYYCNRAAAYSKLNMNMEAIKDCEMAIKINNQYSKAYARMGLAYSAMLNHEKAVEAYRNALRIDPVNQGYQQNLSLAEARMRGEAVEAGAEEGAGLSAGLGGADRAAGAGAPGGPGGVPGGLGSFDFSSFLNNPALLNMASQLMSSPHMQSLMSNILAGNMQQQQQPQQQSSQQPGGAPSNSSNDFLTMGHAIAQQMQNQHPELVETLRQRYQSQQQQQENNATEPDSRPDGSDQNDPNENA